MELVPKNLPVIFAVNHQNTMLDATLVAHLLKKNTFFLVRSDVFKGKFINWLFKILYLIPISREQDGRNNMAEFNKKSFAKCIEYLEKKKLVLIFPEGESKASYKLSKVKKGVARLALEAEMKNNFKLNVQVIPVAINYENHFQGNSDIWIKYCEPITLDQYKKEYSTNRARALNSLVNKIETNLSDNVIKFDQHQTARSFFNTVAHNPVSKTSELISLYEAFIKDPPLFEKNIKHNQHFLFYFTRAVLKTMFAPAIALTMILVKIINDDDFKLSITSLSLAVFSIFQILLLMMIITFQVGITQGIIIASTFIVAFPMFIKTYFTK